LSIENILNILGTVGSAQKNLIPDTPLEKHDVDFLIDEVVEIDREKRSVKTQGGKEIAYHKLIIATGSLCPRLLPGRRFPRTVLDLCGSPRPICRRRDSRIQACCTRRSSRPLCRSSVPYRWDLFCLLLALVAS
jgi:hypothetical protein